MSVSIQVAGGLSASPVSTITREASLVSTSAPLTQSVVTLGSAALQRAASENFERVRKQVMRQDTDAATTALASVTQAVDDILPPLNSGMPPRMPGSRSV